MTRSRAPGRRAAALRLLRAARGGASVEFALMSSALIGIMVFAVQVAAAHFIQVSAVDAARRTARLAATLPIAHCAALRDADGRRLHALSPDAQRIPTTPRDRACLNAPSPCAPSTGAWTCAVGDGAPEDAACDAAVMARLRAEAEGPGLDLSRLSVTYRDSRLGELGGPVVPRISVTLRPAALRLRSLFADAPGALAPAAASAVGERLDGAQGPTC